ncbi:hypothetical protein BPOR_0278g00130 [Botrytis porri]|uniref:Uncharacterized protein n=1 Tax=Botrytis porri TaxID=87229 RepID=A0A4Z1KL23_9HELO|nr:hypothetical protein BPOR_0278g00130 [Botrytis porri]
MWHSKHTVGSLLEHLENYDENQSFESLLYDEEFASLLRGIFTSLPTEFQNTAQAMLAKTNQHKKKKTKISALSAVIEINNIALPPTLQDHYRLWKENPSRFWHPVESSITDQSLEFIAVEAYLVVRSLHQRKRVSIIELPNNLYQRLIKATQCEKIPDEKTLIKTNLQTWVAAGSRYNKICMALDKSALFLLPQISDAIWENSTCLKGAEFGDAMSHLRSQGIMELSGQLEADAVANKILDAALGHFKWNVVDSRTFTANQSIAPKIFPVDTYAESGVVEAGPSIVSQAVTAGPSSELRAFETKPISIFSLLNSPEAAHD